MSVLTDKTYVAYEVVGYLPDDEQRIFARLVVPEDKPAPTFSEADRLLRCANGIAKDDRMRVLSVVLIEINNTPVEYYLYLGVENDDKTNSG